MISKLKYILDPLDREVLDRASSISFSAASMVLDLSWFMVSASYRRRASTLCRELRLSALLH